MTPNTKHRMLCCGTGIYYADMSDIRHENNDIIIIDNNNN